MNIVICIDHKIAAGCHKDEITPSLKTNYRLKFSHYVEMNNVREKGKPRYKLSFKVFREQYG